MNGKMFLELERKELYDDRTIGGFYINGVWAYFTLEDKDRRLEEGGVKIPGMTAIPRGHYKVTISWSNRFHRFMPHILDVPNFAGVRIHTGNTPVDTDGCILIGLGHDVNTHNILKSQLAFDDFFPRLEKGLFDGDVWITIS